MKFGSLLCHAALVLMLSLLVGCAGQPLHAPLPNLSALPESDTRMQRLSFRHQDQQYELIGALRHDKLSLRLALLSPQGQRLLTMVHDNEGARFLPDASFVPPFTAEWLASRLAWGLWPSSALARAFEGSDWSLLERHNKRTILYQNRTVAHVTGDSKCRTIDDIEGGYRLHIAPLDNNSDRTAAKCPAE